MKELKEFKKANNEQVIEIAKELWQDQKMQDYLVKGFDFYFTKDNLILEVEKASKLFIAKDMYYDDETEAPEKDLETFIYYNKNNCYYFNNIVNELNHVTKLYFCNIYNNLNNTCVYVGYDRYNNNIENVRNAIRELTQEEVKDVLEIYEEQQIKYIERITKYFKKYNKNISIVGYWANR